MSNVLVSVISPDVPVAVHVTQDTKPSIVHIHIVHIVLY